MVSRHCPLLTQPRPWDQMEFHLLCATVLFQPLSHLFNLTLQCSYLPTEMEFHLLFFKDVLQCSTNLLAIYSI